MRIDAIASGAVCYLNLLKSVADGAQIVAAHLGGLERRTGRGLILLDDYPLRTRVLAGGEYLGEILHAVAYGTELERFAPESVPSALISA